jgi:hypothetical protein
MGSFTHFMVNWSTTTWRNGEGNWKYVKLSCVSIAIYIASKEKKVKPTVYRGKEV